MNLAALKTEIADAAYEGLDDVQIADKLNKPDKSVDRDTLTGGDIAAAISRTDYGNLQAADKQYVQMLVAASNLPVTKNLKDELRAMFADASETKKRIVALIKRTGSRAEELGLGSVTPSDVANARRPDVPL